MELHVGDLDLQKGSHVLSEIVFFAGRDEKADEGDHSVEVDS